MVAFDKLKLFFSRKVSAPVIPSIGVSDLKPYAFFEQGGRAGSQISSFDGEKFPTGFGTTQIQIIDYWTLRMRSSQLFNENLYARGVVRRLITNEINTGLTVETMPNEDILGLSDDTLDKWSETVEDRFALWGKDPRVCDWKHKHTFGGLQRAARTEALVSGDVLVVERHSRRTRLPQIQLISGNHVMTPAVAKDRKVRKGNKLIHGVEIDKDGRHVAFFIRQEDGSFKRLPAFGEKSGRRIAWLVYGTDKRLDEIRGQPLLSLVLQSLKELDRYRESAQRQAVINSILAMFIEKTEEKMGTLPISGGAIRREAPTVTDGDGTKRTFNIAKMIPGLVIEELEKGEKPTAFTKGTDIDFEAFERAIVAAIAWANEIPPEILLLSFSNNYSASQAAINEFKIYLNKVWGEWGESFCQPIYQEWLISETLRRNIDAPGLLESWRAGIEKYAEFWGWVAAEWFGSVKPSTDMLKQAKGSKLLVAEGWSTNARESRGLTGSKFRRNIRKLKRENELKVEAMRPLAEFKQEFGEPLEKIDPTGGGSTNTPQALGDMMEELLSRVEEN